jgi:hypothetical protein
MEKIIETFNNREIALSIYLIIALFWVMTQKNVRESLFNVLKILTNKFIFISILDLLLYISLFIYVLYLIKFWEFIMIKDTIYWTFGVGFILMMNSDKALKENHYFRKIILDNCKLILIIEFLINLYVFGLVTELILMPFVILFSMMLGYTEVHEEYTQVKKLIQFVFGIIGTAYLIYSGYMIFKNFNTFASTLTLKSFLLPILLTLLFLPFAYSFALYMHYESLFRRIKFSLNENKVLRNYAKKRILIEVNFSLSKLKKITPGFPFNQCKTKEDVIKEIRYKLEKRTNPVANMG